MKILVLLSQMKSPFLVLSLVISGLITEKLVSFGVAFMKVAENLRIIQLHV